MASDNPVTMSTNSTPDLNPHSDTDPDTLADTIADYEEDEDHQVVITHEEDEINMDALSISNNPCTCQTLA